MFWSRTYKRRDFAFLHLRRLLAEVLFATAWLLIAARVRRRGTALLLKSIRTYGVLPAIRLLKHQLDLIEPVLIDFARHNVSVEEPSIRSIFLSLPDLTRTPVRKGVMVVTFTSTIAYYLRHPKFELLDRYFVFVLEPSWAGYADPEILLFLRRAEHCLVQATEQTDRTFLNAVFMSAPAVSFGASDWVNPSVFMPNGAIKRFDSIYVANNNPIKRVQRYIDAVAAVCLEDPSYAACLVCAPWGGKSDDIRKYIAKRGVEGNLMFIPGLDRASLVQVVNESKVNVLLSFKEGSNRSLFESMFADVPVICVSENVGVNKSYINEFTGLLVSDAFLEDALRAMKERWVSYRPRSWAMEHISPVATTLKLKRLLDARFGGSCNAEICAKTNDPEVAYLDRSVDSAVVSRKIHEALDAGDERTFLTVLDDCVLPQPSIDGA